MSALSDGFAVQPETSEPLPADTVAETPFHKHYPELKGISAATIRKAWFSLSHLPLSDGACVADMACVDGAMTYAMAVMNPHLSFIGLDLDKKKIARARQLYKRENLQFRTGNLTKDSGFEPESLDAIINSFTLHEIYSGASYDDWQVIDALEYQFTLLRQDGMMFIRDYALRNTDDYVLLEMPETTGTHTDPQTMPETDLLVWYSHNARPRDDIGGHGFFLEELPPRFPKTRLFRLPYKWAYEFVIRKDDRAALMQELDKEYAFFTPREFNKHLQALGARALYTSPHWDDNLISKCFDGHFRMYDDGGQNMGPPPTSFIAVAQKTGAQKSLRLQERRPSQSTGGSLRVQSMRNEKTGRIADIVVRDNDITEVLPYFVKGDNELYVYIHESLPRGIINAVPRQGRDIDGKNWSGHMIEPVSISTDVVRSVEKNDIRQTVRFAQQYLGLKPAIESYLEDGPSYYPAPDFIDDLIKTSYLRVTEHEGVITPQSVIQDISGFTTFGRIRAVKAQSLLDAVSVGLIPNARLELQLLALFQKLKIKATAWHESPLILEESEPDILFNGKDYMRLKAVNDDRFKKVRGNAGQFRTMQSVFVDEGLVNGGIKGLAARDMEFIIPDSGDKTLNKAVIMPLTKQAGQVLVGFEVEYMPIPQRHQGNGLTMRAPSVNLPKDVTNIHQARLYIADLFKVPPENVWRMGESYFCHSGITPMRIFPFAVATKGRKESPIGGPINFAPMKAVWRLLDILLMPGQDLDTTIKMARVQRRISATESDLGFDRQVGLASQKDFSGPSVNVSSSITGIAPAEPQKLQIK